MQPDILKQMEPVNAALQSLREKLYNATVAAIIQLIRPLMETHPDGIECPFLYRYIDDDCEQSVYRVKKVWLDGNNLIALVDSNTGENWAADLHAGPEYDEDFGDETEENLSIRVTTTFDIDYVTAIYDNLYKYVIPRLLHDEFHDNVIKHLNEDGIKISPDDELDLFLIDGAFDYKSETFENLYPTVKEKWLQYLKEKKTYGDVDEFFDYVTKRFKEEGIEIGDAGDTEELYQVCGAYDHDNTPFEDLYPMVKADWLQYLKEKESQK